MHIEDSYEGAARRLARLSHAGVDLLPTRRDNVEASLQGRMRDLEELATLATEENERLERELAAARETIERLQTQLTEVDRQRLRDLVEEAPARPRPPRRSIAPLLIGLAGAGTVLAAAVLLQPWQYAPRVQASLATFVQHHTHPWAMPLDSVATQVVVAPAATAPKPAAAAPTPAVVPAAEAPAVAVAEAPTEKPAAQHRAKHHHHVAAAKKAKAAAPVAKASSKPAKSSSSDLDSMLGL
jgi:hypothetical protein